MISICEDCKQDRFTVKGCSKTRINIGGTIYKRMTGAYEKGKKFKQEIKPEIERCDDCGAYEDNVHHFGCAQELCPVHKTPIISCDCNETVPVV